MKFIQLNLHVNENIILIFSGIRKFATVSQVHLKVKYSCQRIKCHIRSCNWLKYMVGIQVE